MALPVVDRRKALRTPQQDPLTPPATTAEPAKTYRFVRTVAPGEPITLPSGKVVQFHVPRDNETGRLCVSGRFETSDAELAEELRQMVSGNYVHEI